MSSSHVDALLKKLCILGSFPWVQRNKPSPPPSSSAAPMKYLYSGKASQEQTGSHSTPSEHLSGTFCKNICFCDHNIYLSSVEYSFSIWKPFVSFTWEKYMFEEKFEHGGFHNYYHYHCTEIILIHKPRKFSKLIWDAHILIYYIYYILNYIVGIYICLMIRYTA